MNINEQLLAIYNDKWDDLCINLGNFDRETYSNPLLLAFDNDKYEQSDLKVMIFGQETKGWLSRKGSLKTTDIISSQYYNFFCLEKFYSGYQRSSFWKAFRFFQKELQEAHPNKNLYFSWNNINKIGKAKGTGINLDIETIEREYFSVIASEVELFQPDIIIFLTGPNRDSQISYHFKDAEFIAIDENIKKRALARVKSKFLPEKTIRMYHPSYYGGFNKLRFQAVSFLST